MASISNGVMRLDFSESTGDWIFFGSADSTACSFVQRPGPAFDLIVDNKPFFGVFPRRLSSFTIAHNRLSIELLYECDGLQITHRAALQPDTGIVLQSVHIVVLSGSRRALNGVYYFLPTLCVGDASDCLIQTFDQHLVPETPYAMIAAQPLDWYAGEPLPNMPQGWLTSCPDQGSGLIAFENRVLGESIAVCQFSENATSFPTLHGDGTFVSVTYRHQIAAWLLPGVTVISDGHYAFFSKANLESLVDLYRNTVYADWGNAPDIAPWVHNARLLQIDPYPISKWTCRLTDLAKIGFNLLYCTPVQAGNWYVIDEHYAINPAVGTHAELQAFVTAAHACGMRVIFDFIPQGIGIGSPFIKQHPDWLVRNQREQPFGSHGWGPRPGAPEKDHQNGTYSMDWGRPDYQDFVIAWAIWYVKTFDIDGFRTDALHWKEPNFAANNPYPAWQTMFGGVRLADRLRAAVKAEKPDTLLLAEVGGPIFCRSHDASYDNSWIGANYVIRGWLDNASKMTPRQWCESCARIRDVYPANMIRANFACNHDLLEIGRKMAEHPLLGNAITFMVLFSDGFPFICWYELEGREHFLAQVLAAHKLKDGYRFVHRAAKWSAEELSVNVWTNGHSTYCAVANISDKEVFDTITLLTGGRDPQIVFGATGSACSSQKNGQLRLQFMPGGYALIRVSL